MIESLSQQHRSVDSFAQSIRTDCFDEEDRKVIDKKIADIVAAKKAQERLLKQKQDIYKNQIVHLETQLTQRQRVLESSETQDRVFKEFPDILEYFARKQAKLTDALSSIKTDLQKTK